MTKSEEMLASDPESFETAEARVAVASFNAFYDFAFPRIYRYAQRRMANEVQAQALCRLVFIRAMATLGGLDVIEDRLGREEEEFAFWLFDLSRRTADLLCDQLSEYPELLVTSDLERAFEEQTLEILGSACSSPRSGVPEPGDGSRSDESGRR